MSLRDELIAALSGWSAWQPVEGDDQSLIGSGRLDSSALFELSLWIEERVGRPLDPATFSVARDWDSPRSILVFIERARTGAAPMPEAKPTPAVRAGSDVLTRSGIEIVHYTGAYKSAVLELQKRLWSTDEELNRRFFEWRYERNPVLAAPLICLALSGGRPIAMRGAFASRWQAGSSSGEFIAYLSDDLVVLPEFESQGIFKAFKEHFRAELAARGCRFFLSLSALRVTRMQSLAEGAHSIGSMEPVGRLSASAVFLDRLRTLLRPLPYVWRLDRFTVPSERASRAFDRIDLVQPESRGPWRLSAGTAARPSEMAALIRSLGHDGRIRQVRDEAYFAWRYLSPLHAYRIFYADSADGLAGYLVLERPLSNLGNPRRIHIADWEAGSPYLLSELLSTAIRWARTPELATWTRTLGDERIRALRDSGFAPVDPQHTARGLPSVLIWSLTEEQDDTALAAGGRSLRDLANWDLRIVDTSLG
jgi:GNAT superfamily N-acetyltransferase/acyl carrier protein